MAIIKDHGVVLREYAAGESNKKLVLLTASHGKLTAFARGSRRVGSKLASDLFCYNEFIFFDGGSFLSLNQVSPIKHFAGIADDFDSYCYACYLLEIADAMLLPKMETGEALRLILHGLNELSTGRLPPKVIFAAFTFKFLQIEGFAPLVDCCMHCEKQITFDGDVWLLPDGLVCGLCASGGATGGTLLSPQARAALEYILKVNSENVFAFNASPDVYDQLHHAAGRFLSANVDVEFKSLMMFK